MVETVEEVCTNTIDEPYACTRSSPVKPFNHPLREIVLLVEDDIQQKNVYSTSAMRRKSDSHAESEQIDEFSVGSELSHEPARKQQASRRAAGSPLSDSLSLPSPSPSPPQPYPLSPNAKVVITADSSLETRWISEESAQKYQTPKRSCAEDQQAPLEVSHHFSSLQKSRRSSTRSSAAVKNGNARMLTFSPKQAERVCEREVSPLPEPVAMTPSQHSAFDEFSYHRMSVSEPVIPRKPLQYGWDRHTKLFDSCDTAISPRSSPSLSSPLKGRNSRSVGSTGKSSTTPRDHFFPKAESTPCVPFSKFFDPQCPTSLEAVSSAAHSDSSSTKFTWKGKTSQSRQDTRMSALHHSSSAAAKLKGDTNKPFAINAKIEIEPGNIVTVPVTLGDDLDSLTTSFIRKEKLKDCFFEVIRSFFEQQLRTHALTQLRSRALHSQPVLSEPLREKFAQSPVVSAVKTQAGQRRVSPVSTSVIQQGQYPATVRETHTTLLRQAYLQMKKKEEKKQMQSKPMTVAPRLRAFSAAAPPAAQPRTKDSRTTEERELEQHCTFSPRINDRFPSIRWRSATRNPPSRTYSASSTRPSANASVQPVTGTERRCVSPPKEKKPDFPFFQRGSSRVKSSRGNNALEEVRGDERGENETHILQEISRQRMIRNDLGEPYRVVYGTRQAKELSIDSTPLSSAKCSTRAPEKDLVSLSTLSEMSGASSSTNPFCGR